MPHCGKVVRGKTGHQIRQAHTRLIALLAALSLAILGLAAAPATASGPEDPEPPEPTRELFPSPPDLLDQPDGMEQQSVIPNSYIVILDDGISHPGMVAQEQADELGAELNIVYQTALNGYSADDLSPADVKVLRADPEVKYVEPNRRIFLSAQTVPTGVSRIFASANEALDIDGMDDNQVNADVAVIDGRIDHTHPDLQVVARVNCVPSKSGEAPVCVTDTGSIPSSHATRVAGIVGAKDNGFGAVGVAPGVRLWGVRVFNDEGVGQTDWTNAAIDWVATHASDIEVANMSLGGEGKAPSQDEAIAKATAAGVVGVVAAGNQSENTAGRHPANSPDAITVSALADYDGQAGGVGPPTCIDRGDDDTLGTFSNWGDEVELAAPGVCSHTTEVGAGYAFAKWGTSFATPHVAGAAAFLASKANPGSSEDVEEIRRQLIDDGSLNWSDSSEDGAPEPLLYLGNVPLTQVEAATGGWTTADDTTATLTGAVNTRGLAGEYRFEYGPTTSYGQSAPIAPAQIGLGTGYKAVSQSIPGPGPEQAYHYRLSITTSTGTVHGEDRVLVMPRFSEVPNQGHPEAQSEWLNDLSCPAADTCFATGYYRTEGNHMGVRRLSNGEWSFSSLPQPEGSSFPQAFGVSCSTPSSCTAVGRAQVGGRKVPLALRWNGTSWSLQSVPDPFAGAPESVLSDISCASSNDCMAVGFYKDAGGKYVNYAAQWKSNTWTSMSPPTREGATQSVLEDVSCVSASACTAVGWINTGGSGSKPVIVTWNGSTWKLGETARSTGTLYGISCTSSSSCVAVGGQLWTEIWNGSKWSSSLAAKPEGASGGYIESVSCTHASYCLAVGAWNIGPRTLALTEAWDGSVWKVEPAPRNAEANSPLSSVWCVSLVSCIAVGGMKEGSWKALIAQRKDVVTAPPTAVLPGQATLEGTIDPGGLSTTYKFEFGKTTAYGLTVPASGSSAGSGTSTIEVSDSVGELEPETTYHYRLVASSAAGTVYGKDVSFRSGTPKYNLTRSFGSSGSAKGQVDAPWGLDIDAEGNVWVADRNNHRIEKYSASGQFVLVVGGGVNKTTGGNICTASSNQECGSGTAGAASSQFREPLDIAITSAGDLWVTDGGNNRVQKFDAEGAYLGQFGSSGSGNGQFTEPWGIDIASTGDIWVADARAYRVQKFNSSGGFILKATGFEGPRGLEVDANNHVWVTERTANRVQELGPGGEKLIQFGSSGTGPGQFDEPQAIDVKGSTDLVVTDRFNDRVQQFSAAGEFVTQFGNDEVVEPRGIVDASAGIVYVSNSWKDRIDEWRQNIPWPNTGAAANQTSTGATLAGTVNPRGVSTEYRFEYGKTLAYGSKTANASAGSGTGDLTVSKEVDGLTPSTTYHFRVVATSVEGTIYGKDQTFTTTASVANSLATMAVTEPFNASAESLANFAGKWSALGWAGGGTPKGSNTATGWKAANAYSVVNGASYNPVLADAGTGIATAATLTNGPGSSNRYFSLWLDMPTPTGTKAGYELRFTYTGVNAYTVSMSKWAGGGQTTLATQSNVGLVVGNSVALVDQTGTVSAWVNTGSGFTQLLSAGDASFSSGATGVEASGNATRLNNFKAGAL